MTEAFELRMSPTIGKLAEALSKAQGMMGAAHKDKENPFFKSHYATLASVITAIKEPFRANGLAYSQPTHVDATGRVFVITMVLHSSGEWLAGILSAKPKNDDPQGVGSLTSYLRRYGLQGVVGISSADDDDDGNSVSGSQPVTDEYYKGTPEQEKRLSSVLKKEGVDESLWEAVGTLMKGRPTTLLAVKEAIRMAVGEV